MDFPCYYEIFVDPVDNECKWAKPHFCTNSRLPRPAPTASRVSMDGNGYVTSTVILEMAED